MKLDVSQALKNEGQRYAFEGTVELPAMNVMGDDVKFEGITVKGESIAAEGNVSVRADVTATVKTRCCLCLTDVEYPIKTRLLATFVRKMPEDDPDCYPLEGYMADIDRAASDALLLELPMRSLCRDDCKGLCPVCGVNRNVDRCVCQEGGGRPNPFSALTEMLSKNEEV